MFEWAGIIAVALVIAFVVKTFVVEAYKIPSGSMEPTIHVDDRVLVNKLAYDLGPVRRGNIIVFATPASFSDPSDPSVRDLIKRVIGLPGETLRSGPNGEIFVNGKLIAQPWVTAEVRDAPQPTICDPQPGYSHVDCDRGTLRLPKDEYYVMGDNRDDSDDSRYWGPVTGHLIVGQTVIRIWPLTRLHWF